MWMFWICWKFCKLLIKKNFRQRIRKKKSSQLLSAARKPWKLMSFFHPYANWNEKHYISSIEHGHSMTEVIFSLTFQLGTNAENQTIEISLFFSTFYNKMCLIQVQKQCGNKNQEKIMLTLKFNRYRVT